MYQHISNHDFWQWLQNSGSYKDNFTYQGSKALIEHLEQCEEDTGEKIQFDPIALCCEFSEYKDLNEIKENYTNIKSMNDLHDHTQVIEFDGGVIIAEF